MYFCSGLAINLHFFQELESQLEKVQRVNRQISRLEREIVAKNGDEAEYLKQDVRLRTLRDISRAALRYVFSSDLIDNEFFSTMAKLKDTNPEMSPHIEHTINKIGLRLPSPSPSQSPANSARSLSSRTSSIRSLASRQSKQSMSSARSETESLKMKQGNATFYLILLRSLFLMIISVNFTLKNR